MSWKPKEAAFFRLACLWLALRVDDGPPYVNSFDRLTKKAEEIEEWARRETYGVTTGDS